MSRPDPIFDKSDSAALDDLPVELQGKTPKEIAAYYQRREQLLLERTRQTPPPPPPPKKEEPIDDKIDLFGDPAGSISRVATRIADQRVKESESRMASVATPAIVNSCRLTIRERYADYPRFSSEVEKRMSVMTPEAQMNPEYWDYTYKIVKGEAVDKLIEEARTDERNKQNPVERSTPPGAKPPKPKELSDEEKDIARKFGMTPDEYREAADRYDRTDGVLPLTFDTRRPRKKESVPK